LLRKETDSRWALIGLGHYEYNGFLDVWLLGCLYAPMPAQLAGIIH